ncbi:MAG: ribonuclease P protein component [Mycoplasma sp.]|nr:ribonuclease P protein component [Mycoplasma sp.]
MKKKHILRKNWEFQDIIENNKNQKVNKYLILYYRPNNENLRVGISVPKKTGNAPFRNYLKRQIRNIFDQLNQWKLKFDIVLILRKPFLQLTFQTKKEAIQSILEKI